MPEGDSNKASSHAATMGWYRHALAQKEGINFPSHKSYTHDLVLQSTVVCYGESKKRASTKNTSRNKTAFQHFLQTPAKVGHTR